MDKKRKIIISILISVLVITSGTIYYESYVSAHTGKSIGLDFTIKTVNIHGQSKLQINVTAVINSTNYLTKFSFNENQYVEGIDLVYLGNNSTYANQLLNDSPNHQGMASTLLSFDHFLISNQKPYHSSIWNETICNISKNVQETAPYGYYFPNIHLVSSGLPFPFILKVTRGLVLFNQSGITIVS